MKTTPEKVIAKLIKWGFNKETAKEMTRKYWELAASKCLDEGTTRNMADAVSWFWAV